MGSSLASLLATAVVRGTGPAHDESARSKLPARDSGSKLPHSIPSVAPRTSSGSGVCGQTAMSYLYDPDGRRVARLQNGPLWKQYYYDGAGNMITEADGSGNTLRAEIYAGSRHLATWNSASGGATYFNHADWLGTERVRTRASDGSVCESITSLPFGDGEATIGPCAPSPTFFTGKERDSESGLDYFGARYNASSLGRFMTPDPTRLSAFIDDPQTWNMYTNAHNNPLAHVDRNGKWPTRIHNQIYAAALGAYLTPEQRQIVQSVSAGQDNPFLGGQFNGVAYEHAMRGPGQTVEQAEALYNDFVSEEVQAAQEAQIKFWKANPASHSLSDEALVHFAMALHAVIDSTSPAHAGFQYWNWMNPFLVRRHTRAESSITPRQFQTAVSAAQGLFGQTFGMFGFDEFDLLSLELEQEQHQQQLQQEQQTLVTSRICSGLDENNNCSP